MDSAQMRINEYLERIASKEPTPGGGGVAGLAGALAAALGEMVLAFSVGRKELDEHQGQLAECSRSVHAMRQRLVELADEDAQAYSVLNQAMKLDKDSPDRQVELAKAALGAAQVPLEVIRVSAELMLCFEAMSEIINRWMRSDLAIAVILTDAVARASRWNIVVNTQFMDGMGYGLLDDADGLLERIDAGAQRTVATCG